MSPTIDDRLLSMEAVAHLLDVSKRTVARMSRDGKLPDAVDLNGAPRWRHRDIQDWIAAGLPDVKSWQRGRRNPG